VLDSTDILDKQIRRVGVSVMVYSAVYSPCRFHCDFSGTVVSHCTTCVTSNARDTVDCSHTYVLVQSTAWIEFLLWKAAHLSEKVRDTFRSDPLFQEFADFLAAFAASAKDTEAIHLLVYDVFH